MVIECVIKTTVVAALLGLMAVSGLASQTPKNGRWIGVYLSAPSDQAGVKQMETLIGEKLAPMGVNAIVLEVGSEGFKFESDPELKKVAGGMTKEMAGELAAFCKARKVRLIPLLNCIGHQSWAADTGGLLRAHPEIDETPGKYPDNKGIYCRSWCTSNPDSHRIVFGMIDELIKAFKTDAVHVGMDEIFLIGDKDCPRCKGKNPGELLANAINKFHDHIVKKRKCEMMMWGDRLLNGKETGYGEWEAAANGTETAIDKIPKDIVLCDWHYEKRASYPSIPLFINKGFRVWPGGWRNADASEAFVKYSLTFKDPKMVGHLFTTWSTSYAGLLDVLKTPDKPKPEKGDESWGVAQAFLRCIPLLKK